MLTFQAPSLRIHLSRIYVGVHLARPTLYHGHESFFRSFFLFYSMVYLLKFHVVHENYRYLDVFVVIDVVIVQVP